VEKNVFARSASHDVVAMIASDALRSVVPKDDLSVAVDYVNSGLKAVQNDPKNLWTLKFRHSVLYRNFIGK
jgi:hypothetical protein